MCGAESVLAGGWRARARGRARRGGIVEAKIWTDDGRRKAAELMGLTREVRRDPRPDRADPRARTTAPRARRYKLVSRRPLPCGAHAGSRRVGLRARASFFAIRNLPATPAPLRHPYCRTTLTRPTPRRVAMAPHSQEAADGKILKRAFRRLCLRYHPDIAHEDSAADKFQEIQEAYRVLSDDGGVPAELPDDLEWSSHDWRWQYRYGRGAPAATGSARPAGSDPDAPTSRRVSEDERRSRLDEQLRNMAGAPTRRRRRVIKPLSKTPTPQPAAAEFTEATFDDEGECPSDGCSTEAAAPSEEEEMVANAFRARNVRGYQSDRHSTESAHERINSQLAGLHRKKVIRARADGVDLDRETKKETSRSAARRDGSEHVVKDETNSARFYGGVGLQLEESTPERFLRLAKLAKEWREARSMSDAIYSADVIKPSAKELLQAAVEGASLGACA